MVDGGRRPVAQGEDRMNALARTALYIAMTVLSATFIMCLGALMRVIVEPPGSPRSAKSTDDIDDEGGGQ